MSSIPDTLPKFLWHYAKRYKLYLSGIILVAVFWAVNLSLTPYAMKLIIDRVSDWNGVDSLYTVLKYPAALYIGLGIWIGLIFRFYDLMMIRTFPKMRLQITAEMFAYVEEHSYTYFQHSFAGSLGNKINDMSKSATTIISNLIDNFLARVLSLVIGATTMFLVSPYFAAVLVTWSIIFITVSVLLSLRAQNYAEIASDAHSTAVGKVVDSITNIMNVKLFAREGYEGRYLNGGLEDAANKDRRSMWYLLKVKIFYAISITILTVTMMGLLIHERAIGTVTVGDFALILTLNMFLIEEVFFIASQLVPFSEEVGTCKQALSIISEQHGIVDNADAKPLIVSRGRIEFDSVHFGYKDGQRVFTDKSITIHAGERVGLVGSSGSGKSTFVNLILRFFDVDSGRILIDGQDIKEVTQESLRRQIAMIPQDPLLFHRSLAENIGYGRLDANFDEIMESSKKAHCHEFIEVMQDGYQSLVGERGVKLSGGQRQRIAIARAMLKNAPILILDEATSSLDSETEDYIQRSLALLMEGRTTIVIAHRLSTLSHMTRILVFSGGRVIEDGTHAELISLGGHYAKLWSMQAGGFLVDP